MQGGPRVKHLDDLPWVEVARIQLPDRIASIWEKWIELSPRFVCYYNKWDPGMLCPRHGHHGDHAVFVVEGEIASGNLVCRVGSHIMLEYGDTFGPWTAGPQGAVLYGWMAGGMGHPFTADDEGWLKFLAERGAKEIVLPPPKLPPWFGKTSVLLNPVGEKA